ncbi:MAG: pyridoxal phosphate-dependent aminotransferase [Spirochaetales bacterium]|nr:pyridoxal phosphate-dependent aminotransferase [Spirochaetales bacterium]
MAVADNIRQMMTRSSWIRRMFEAGAELKAQHGADKVCDFSLGNPNLMPPPEFRETLIRLARDDMPMKHSYMPNAGYPAVRGAVADYIREEYGIGLKPDNVIMTCGAGGGLNVILKTMLNPGDKMLVSTPCFVEYRFYVENHGGTLEFVPGKQDFDLDVEALEESIDARTAGIIINSPNNPSGRVYPEETIRELCAMLERKSSRLGKAVYLVSDEPYRRIVFDGNKVPSLFKFYDNTIIVTSFSKDLSIPGERIGWLAVHPQADDGANLINGCILCNRILGYVNAPALMQRAVADLLRITIDVGEYQYKRDKLYKSLQHMGYEVRKPEGAFYLFPQAPGGDDLAFVDMLRQELILAVPGRGFALPGYFRLAYCVDDEIIERSLAGFSRAIKKIPAA